jgi:hypothetical protein
MGGAVNGGRLYGQWPGLRNDQLFDGADLAVTTDYRTVLSEILNRRLGNGDLATIFPGLEAYRPLGVVQGADVPVNLPVTPPPPLPPGLDNSLFLPAVNRGSMCVVP